MQTDLEYISERVVFESRWLLLPFNLGLIVALACYLIRFMHEDYLFVRQCFSLSFDEVMVSLLALVDCYMVANLMIMIIKGSYQIFIHKFHVSAEGRPGWLDHIDTGLLKVKTTMSIASITMVSLLTDFFSERINWEDTKHRLVIHLVCVLSAVMMAVIWKVTHESGPGPKEGIGVGHEQHS